jgi:hypothetical protein
MMTKIVGFALFTREFGRWSKNDSGYHPLSSLIGRWNFSIKAWWTNMPSNTIPNRNPMAAIMLTLDGQYGMKHKGSP